MQGRLHGNHRIEEICQRQESAIRIRKLLSDILGRAEGIFLWVRLVTDELCRGLTEGLALDELEAAIRRIPDDWQSFFRHILMKTFASHLESRSKYRRRESFIILEVVLRSRGTGHCETTTARVTSQPWSIF